MVVRIEKKKSFDRQKKDTSDLQVFLQFAGKCKLQACKNNNHLHLQNCKIAGAGI
jgi:hypothetical protein